MEEIEKTGQEENKAQPVPEENVAAEANLHLKRKPQQKPGLCLKTRMKQLLLEKKVPHPLCPLTNTWQQVFT